MGIFNALTGYVCVELTSADITGIFFQINRLRIPLFDLQIIEDMTVRFRVSYRGLKTVREITERKGDCIKIISRGGLYGMIRDICKRPLLILGMVLVLGLSVFLPDRILFVETEGNEDVPSQLILETASEAGIGFGAYRRDVRSERMKNELLSMLPQLQWAGVNTYGCRAVISVRERATESRKPLSSYISRIVASCDGLITSCVVTRGSGLCSVGQAVQKGQVLVSGYTDCGGIITAGRAEGEIFAQTQHEMTAVTLPNVCVRGQISGRQTKYSLCIGKKRINLYKGSGISDASCAKIVSQYHLALPGGYILPVTLIKEQYLVYHQREQKRETDYLPAKMSVYLLSLLRSDCVALSVVDAEETFDNAGTLISLNGIYNCIEMIGREQGEQLGEFYNETD